ncbi:MAG TPA: hypothetical protein VM537_31595 [Anaerolineae bacterium]|nr:hypothetical protein [Anaerolineae bacterium]
MNHARKGQGKVKVGWTVFSLCVIIASVVVFNLYPQKVGRFDFSTGPVSFAPLLAPSFQARLPWLNIWWVSLFSLQVVELLLRRRTMVTQSSAAALDLFGACLLVQMAFEPPILAGAGPLASNAGKLLILLAIGLVLSAGKRLVGQVGLKPIIIQWEQGERADRSV